MSIDWNEMDTIQKSVSILEMDARDVLNCLKQYHYFCEFTENNINFINRARYFMNTVFHALRTDVLLGTACLVDDQKGAMSVLKILNQLEQNSKYRVLLKSEIANARAELLLFKPTIDTVKYLRDKFYAHNDTIVFKQSLIGKEFDIFDSSIWNDIIPLLEWMINLCVKLRKAYGDDAITIFRTENDFPRLFDFD